MAMSLGNPHLNQSVRFLPVGTTTRCYLFKNPYELVLNYPSPIPIPGEQVEVEGEIFEVGRSVIHQELLHVELKPL